MPKKKVDESAIIGTPVTSEDLKEQGIENYGDEIVEAKEEAKEEAPAEEAEAPAEEKEDKE